VAYEIKEPFWQFVDHWQTPIAGELALVAALGTIWATIISASREIKAAQAQTRAAQEQTAAMVLLERRRIARETFAFMSAVEAAMDSVKDDTRAAREIASEGAAGTHSPPAYRTRQSIKKTAFPYLLEASLRLGGDMTAGLLQLDKEIDRFAARCAPIGPHGVHMGATEGLVDELDRIESKAKLLRQAARAGKNRCRNLLRDTPEQDAP
jgi:hypothetical protein